MMSPSEEGLMMSTRVIGGAVSVELFGIVGAVWV
jgi:hypothetical protein